MQLELRASCTSLLPSLHDDFQDELLEVYSLDNNQEEE